VARYNEILAGRINRSLQKLFAMKGDAVSPQLATEVQPGVVLPFGTEFRYLEQWNRYSISTSVTGGAGQFSGVRLRNPSGSNVIGVIEFVLITNQSAAQSVQVGLGPIVGDLATVLTGQRIDARIQASGQAGVLKPSSSTNTGGALSPQIGTMVLATNTPQQLINDAIQEFTLLPGDAMEVDAGVAATTISVWYIWRERLLEESERF
jgi:hypothetical protein